MGRKSNIKKQRKSTVVANVALQHPNPMDPVLIKAFTRGRSAGYTEGYSEGKVDGIAEIMTLFSQWTDEIDQHVKGIGPATKQNIELYFQECIKKAIEKNKLNSGNVQVLSKTSDDLSKK